MSTGRMQSSIKKVLQLEEVCVWQYCTNIFSLHIAMVIHYAILSTNFTCISYI